VSVTTLPDRPPAEAPVPAFDAVASHDDLVDWSSAYARRVLAASSLTVTLDRVDWEVSTRAKRRAAAVLHPRVPDASVGDRVDWAARDVSEGDGPPRCTVRLTWGAAEAFDRSEWARTLRHELIHVEQFQRDGATGHGPAFRERADTLETTVRCARFTEPRYVLDCGDCGAVAARRYRDCKLVRRHEEYRSSCCDAPLTLRRAGAQP